MTLIVPVPQISVIVPTFGRFQLLLDCVASILKGTYQDYEILIIDQDSTQQLRSQLVQCFPAQARLRYFFLDRAGASRARNFGIQEAQGEIVAFIDDDAVADPLWLGAIHETYRTLEPTPGLVAGRIDPIWPGARPDWYPQECEYLLGLYNIGDEPCLLPRHDQPISANMAGRRQVIQALGGFDEALGPNYFRKQPMLTGEDALLGHRARQAQYSLYYQPHARVSHRISQTKLTKKYFLRRHYWEGVTVIREMQSLGQLNTGKLGHLRYHTEAIAKSLVGVLMANFPDQSSRPRSLLRMLALSRAAYSLGVIHSLLTLEQKEAN